MSKTLTDCLKEAKKGLVNIPVFLKMAYTAVALPPLIVSEWAAQNSGEPWIEGCEYTGKDARRDIIKYWNFLESGNVRDAKRFDF